MDIEQLVAVLEAKVKALTDQVAQEQAEKAELQKKALTDSQIARLQALLS